ncbi:alpha/beta fold hydrolase [Sphingomonas oleivorans]|uniref:alpha/beta fold hydrolase n=1 Tax=Sphingomonas oleivorans TaxID=1735121 RepID=UPI001057162B|nr:alpha/beta fold hydrolase [Sphingomonas oleivorans]
MQHFQRPEWVDEAEYPFRSRLFAAPQGNIHYVDEGEGEVLLFVHGNPTWSFMYRHLIRGLSDRYRCIAPDHLGFGLSDKPEGLSYLPQLHADNLARFIEALGLKEITLVIHDWGGPIGFSYALAHPENVKRLIIFNTSCWSLKGVAGAERFSRVVGSPLGHFVCRTFNAFPRFVIPRVMGDRSRLTPEIHQHYIRPFPTPASRQATWMLAKALIGESDWLASLWDRRARLGGIPVQILCGQKDPTFGPDKLARWEEAFPAHNTLAFPEIGHFVAEELGRDAVAPIQTFLTTHQRHPGPA